MINHWKIHAPSPFLKYFLNVHGNAAKLNDMLEKRVARLKSRDQGLRENQLSVYDKALVTLHEEKKDHPQASLELFVQEFLGLEDVPPSQAEETLGRTIKAHEGSCPSQVHPYKLS